MVWIVSPYVLLSFSSMVSHEKDPIKNFKEIFQTILLELIFLFLQQVTSISEGLAISFER